LEKSLVYNDEDRIFKLFSFLFENFFQNLFIPFILKNNNLYFGIFFAIFLVSNIEFVQRLHIFFKEIILEIIGGFISKEKKTKKSLLLI